MDASKKDLYKTALQCDEHWQDTWPVTHYGPDDQKHPDKPDAAYVWAPIQEAPTINGFPSQEQQWYIRFCRASRHFEAGGTDNTFASKVNKMIRKRPMLKNEEGSEGWSLMGCDDSLGFVAFGPKAKLALRTKAAAKPLTEGESEWFRAHCKETPKARTYGLIKGNSSAEQETEITGTREGDWAYIRTNDNTLITKIRRMATANPWSPKNPTGWLVERHEASDLIRGEATHVTARCPKGCISFRG